MESKIILVEMHGKQLRIRVLYNPPPIPVRSMDWCAFEDGCEEDNDYGYGATEEEALKDLHWMLEEKYNPEYA